MNHVYPLVRIQYRWQPDETKLAPNESCPAAQIYATVHLHMAHIVIDMPPGELSQEHWARTGDRLAHRWRLVEVATINVRKLRMLEMGEFTRKSMFHCQQGDLRD